MPSESGQVEGVSPAPLDALPGFPVVIAIPVQWGDQDALGHVNNIVYFRWCESARIEYLRRLGMDAAGGGSTVGVIVAAIGCDFRRPVTFPDTVVVGARITRIGRSSIGMEHHIYSQAQGMIVAEATSTIVAFDHVAGASRPVPDDVRAAIGRLEGKML
jgi:acyl-CoA thioester hydrolase